MALTPQEQAELDDLELRALESQAAAYEASQADVASSQVDRNRIGATPPPAPSQPSMAGEAADMAASMAIRGGAPAVGQMIGASTGLAAPVAIPVLGGLFGVGGYVADQVRRGEEIKAGELIGEGLAGMIPAASAGKTAVRGAIETGAMNFGASAVQQLIDNGEIDPLQSAMAFAGGTGGEYLGGAVGRKLNATYPNAVDPLENTIAGRRNEVFRKLRREGVVVPPHELNRGSDLLSSVGGKAALQQTAAKKNQDVWQRLAAEELGIIKPGKTRGGGIPIYDETLEGVRAKAAAPYERIKEISATAKTRLEGLRKDLQSLAGGDPIQAKVLDSDFSAAQNNLLARASADVDELKVARANAKKHYDAWRNADGKNPEAYDKWRAELDRASGLEDAIDKAAVSVGDKNLISDLRKSRKLIAQTYSVQEAINPVSGEVDPVAFGRMLRDRVPLSGKLKLIGEAQLVFNKEAVMGSRVPAPGVDNMSTKFALSSAAHGSPAGTLAALGQGTIGAVPRRYYMSNAVQDIMARPASDLRPVQNGLRLLSSFAPRAAGRDNRFLYQSEEDRPPMVLAR